MDKEKAPLKQDLHTFAKDSISKQARENEHTGGSGRDWQKHSSANGSASADQRKELDAVLLARTGIFKASSTAGQRSLKSAGSGTLFNEKKKVRGAARKDQLMTDVAENLGLSLDEFKVKSESDQKADIKCYKALCTQLGI